MIQRRNFCITRGGLTTIISVKNEPIIAIILIIIKYVYVLY